MDGQHGAVRAEIWIIVTDLYTGLWSDRTTSRWGRRRPFLLAGAILVPLTFILLFNVPVIESDGWRAVYVCASLTLFSTCFSLYSVPYLSIASEMSNDPAERTKVMAWRMVFLAVGLLLAGPFVTMLLGIWSENGAPTAAGYGKMSVVVAAICALSMFWCFFGTAKAPSLTPRLVTMPFQTQIRLAFSNRHFRLLVTIAFMQLFSAGLSYTAFLFYMTLNLSLPFDKLMIILTVMSVMVIVAQPMWVAIAGRFGKKTAYFLGSGGYTILVVAWALVPPGDVTWATWQAGIFGVFNAGLTLMAFSMLTDTIEYDRLKTGQSREGVFSAVWSICDKAAMMFGAFVAGLLLSAYGFVTADPGQFVAQSASALEGVFVAFIVVPGVIAAASLLLLYRYGLNEKILADMRSAATVE